MEKTADSNETILLANRLLSKLGEQTIKSLNFDRGFYSKENKELGYVPVNGGIGLIKDITNRLVY